MLSLIACLRKVPFDGEVWGLTSHARLYLLAAQQGYARAQYDIGFMYGFGEGIPPQDDVQAYKWIGLAIDRFTVKNQERREQAIRDRATLAARMSKQQLAEAEAAIKAWRPGK